MYEIDLEGDITTVSAELLIGAWSESSPQAVADAIALDIGASVVIFAVPRVVVRRLR